MYIENTEPYLMGNENGEIVFPNLKSEEIARQKETAETIFESIDAKVGKFAKNQLQADGMSVSLAWIEGADYSYDAFEALVSGDADIDEDGNISDDEEEYYNQLFAAAGDALVKLGAKAADVQTFIDDEDDEKGVRVGNYLSDKLDDEEKSDDQLIAEHAVDLDFDSENQIFEAVKKVVRGGKVVLKKKRIRPRRMNAAQKAALKKARRKSNTAGAKRARAKAMRVRKSRGMK